MNDPWKKYPEFWKTESSFWAWLRGGLRRAVWEKNPIKLETIKQKRVRIPGKKEGTTRYGCECVLCGGSFPQSQIQVDHLEGNIPLRKWDDVMRFVAHMAVPEELQVVCKGCHKIKSHAEKKGISFEDAKIEKKVIEICKQPTKKIMEFLKENNYNGSVSNAKQRREAVAFVLQQEKEKNEDSV